MVNPTKNCNFVRLYFKLRHNFIIGNHYITLRMDIQQLKQRFGIIGNVYALNHAINIATQVAPTDLSVLITGESGVGKEVFPQIIHQFSARKHAPYIAVNCGAIPEGTIDSELFGHQKGAFTGALSDRKGYFEVADKGTIFLDEIGELPLSTQVRLLRVLETGEFIKVGSSKVIKTDVRVVAATNVNLPKSVKEGKFREDLLYRINTIQIEIPPLRDRVEDIDDLASFFLDKYSKKYNKEGLIISNSAINRMKNYDWPGNIRELEHSIEKAVILSSSKTIKLTDLPLKQKKKKEEEKIVTIEEMEKEMIMKALKKYNNNYTEAADKLGVTRQTLYNKMKKYGI